MYPNESGFKMPAEWSRHAGTFMEWPIKEALWPEPFQEIIEAYADIVKKIAEFEPVILVVKPEAAGEAKRYCGSCAKILEILHDDSWMRDNGPTFVVNSSGEIAGINWRFNAWGGEISL